ncbi:MAG: phosphate ABC transporter permease PstA [Planctomycetia bacterium]|nr:phosphate ABC transporter permease PstA [Planctomycetia bacterium]
MKRRKLFWRKTLEWTVFRISQVVLACSFLGMLWILWTTVWNGGAVPSWNFLTQPSKPYGVESGGIANALQGTLYITAIATLLSVPPAVLGGIWMAEFGKKSRLADVIRFCANVMMGIPSIITGLFVYAVWVVPTGHFSGFAGSIALGIIMFPVVMRTTEDMLLLVPDSLREASLALGMNRTRATIQIVCRTARGGLITGILMAFARVAGETAPLLFTALWSNSWCTHYFSGPTANVPVLITEYTTNSPYEAMHAAGWGAAAVMMVLILFLNIGVRCLFGRKGESR